MLLAKITAVFFFAGLAVLYGVTLRALPGNVDSGSSMMSLEPGQTFLQVLPFESSHMRSTYAMILSLAENGTTELTKDLADFGTPDMGYYEGRFYSFFPPGVAFLALPFYFVGQSFNLSLAFVYASISLAALAALLFTFLIARQIFSLPLWAALSVVLITAFTTPFWNHALTLFQHAPTAALLTFAFYAAWRYKQKGFLSWLWAVGVWTAYGVGAFFDYVNVVLFLPVIAYLLYSALSVRRQEGSMRIAVRFSVIATSVAVILLAGVHMFYNVQHFDSPKRFSNALARYEGFNYEELQSADTRAIAERKEQTTSIFKETNIVNGLRVLLFSFDKGLLAYAPVFLFSAFGVWTVRKRLTAEFIVLFGMIATTLLLYASFGDPWGGWSYGPRYLIPIIWILALFCGIWLAGSSFRFSRKLLVSIAFLFSAGVALVGILVSQVLPPKVEAEPLGLSWTYWTKIPQLLADKGNGTLLYHMEFAQYVSLLEYGIVLWSIIAVLTILVMFILPRFRYGN